MTFVDVPNLFQDQRIKDFDRTLLGFMALQMDETNEVRLKQAELAAALKTRSARVSEAIRRLREAHYITTQGYGVIKISPDYYWRSSVSENEALTKLGKK